MNDRLEAVLRHFAVSADVFHAGALCGTTSWDITQGTGQLHLVRCGRVAVHHGRAETLHIAEPSVLLYPQPMERRFVTDPVEGAEFVCAQLRFEGDAAHPIAAALPPWLCLPLAQLDGAQGVLELLFDEAFAERCGRLVLLNRLLDVLLVQILRVLMEQGRIRSGMLAGLAHHRLRLALVALHEDPRHEWTLEALAARAGMSRSVFAHQFREAVGCTPGVYLQRWRIGLAQRSLQDGRSLKQIAGEVGYGSEAALSRAFKAHSGLSPRQWRQDR